MLSMCIVEENNIKVKSDTIAIISFGIIAIVSDYYSKNNTFKF